MSPRAALDGNLGSQKKAFIAAGLTEAGAPAIHSCNGTFDLGFVTASGRPSEAGYE